MKNNKNSTKNVDQNSLDFFGVHSEEELKKEVNQNWNKAKCPYCQYEYDLLHVQSRGGNPVCPRCSR